MKKKLLFLAVALFGLILASPIQSNAANPKVVKLDANKTYTKYDVTGNGTADKFKYVLDESKEATFLYLNGTKRNAIETDLYSQISLISFDSKNVFLAFHNMERGEGGLELDFYKYNSSSKKFQKVYSNESFLKTSSYIGAVDTFVKKMSGKTLYVTQGVDRNGLKKASTFKKSTKAISWDMKYTVKSGKLVLASRTATVNKTPTFTALTTFKTSTTAPTNKYDSFTVKKGDKVKLTKIYFPSGGKTAWFKVEKGSKWGWFQSSSKSLLK